MAGRGRGGHMNFTHEQLNAMGLTAPGIRAEMMAGSVVPPPIFPLMVNKPAPLTIDIKEQYLLMVKRDIVDYLRESSVKQNGTSSSEKSIFQPYGNKYVEILKENLEDNFVWKHLPMELRPNAKRKSNRNTNQRSKRVKHIDIDSRLKLLEQQENATEGRKSGTNDTTTGSGQKNLDGDQDELAELEDPDQPDEEMDMGTDYVNDYFDNGEGFDDDDDNMDEPCF